MPGTRLGPFLLDHENRALWRGREQVVVQPKVFDCLELLAERVGQLTTTTRIRASLWPDVAVGDDAVRQVIAKVRQALRDAGPGQPILRARKGLGYVLEADVEHDPGRRTSLRAEPARGTRNAFVGREHELEVLRRALADAGQGRGSVCLLEGEAGAGKSTLIELLRESASVELLWLCGHCLPDAPGAAFWPFRELTRGLARAASENPGRSAFEKRLASSLEAGKRPGRANAEQASGEQRLFVAQAVSDLLLEWSRQQPLCVVLEDLHWADTASLLCLEMLARGLRDSACVLIASYRPEAAQGQSALSGTLGRLLGRERTQALSLEPLSPLELEVLLDAAAPALKGPAAAQELSRITGGNPLFVQLLLQQGASALSTRDTTRDSFEHAVMARVSALPRPTRDLLERASVLGADFELASLGALGGQASSSVSVDLQPALDARLLRATDHPGRLAFAHVLVAEVLYGQLSLAERCELHLGAFSVLSQAPAVAVCTLSEHAFAAGELVPVETRGALCERAGRTCFEQLDFERAYRELGRAHALLRSSGTPRRTAELLLLRARAAWEADLEEGVIADANREALTAARQAGSATLLAEAAIAGTVGNDSPGEIYRARLRQSQVAVLEQVVSQIDASEAALHHRLTRTLTWLCGGLGDRVAACHWAEQAVHSAPTSPDAWTRFQISTLRCGHAVWAAEPEHARELLAGLGREAHHPDLSPRERLECMLQRMTLCLYVGDARGYSTCAQELPRVLAALPVPPRLGRLGERFCAYALLPHVVALSQSMIAGQFVQAHEHLSALMSEAARLGFGGLESNGTSLLLLLPLLQYQGRARVLEPMVDLARSALDALDFHVAKAQLALEGSARDQAAWHFDALRGLGFGGSLRGQTTAALPRQLVGMADVCASVGSETDAAELYAALQPSAEFFASEGVALSLGACARALGVLAFRLGDLGLAEAHFRRALVLNEQMGHRPELARTRAGLASVLEARGGDLSEEPWRE
ncbi:MAG: DUF2791 family P-loop domain-containing protein [Myxococcales bacterium]